MSWRLLSTLDRVRMRVRDAGPQDAAALAALAEAAMRATYAPIAQAVVYEAVIAQTCTPAAFEAVRARAAADEGAALLVAVEDGTVVGYLDFGPDRDGVLELRRLCTAVGRTGQGIGAALVEALERRLPVSTTYRAIVHARNERGLAFWLRRGFVVGAELDARAHSSEHRGLDLDQPAEHEPSLRIRRTTTAADPP